jgi:hypothetical protein
MKGIMRSLGAMKIWIKPDAKRLNRRPYHLNPKYKEKEGENLDRMLEAWIIVPMEELDWISPMVVQPNNIGDIRIYVDLRNLNVAYVHNPLPTFTDEVLENVGGREAYSFIDGFSGYHKV